ncbi:MAG: NAD(P)-dependent oxidoreductase [Thermodesulfobacteriota bacterium]
MNSVLVTGAGGFLGRFLLPFLAGRGFTVHAAVRPGSEKPGGAHFCHEADLLSPGAAGRLAESVRPSHLVHLAWCSEPSTYLSCPDNRAWVSASRELAAAFAEAGGRRAVFVGSCYEYATGSAPRSEAETPLSPETLYGACKKELFLSLLQSFSGTGTSFCWARPFFLFGPGEKPGRLVSLVAKRILSGRETPPVLGGLVRDYLYIENAAAALALLVQSEIAGPVNLASGAGVTLRSLVLGLCAHLGGEDLVQWAADKEGRHAPRIVADVARLRDEAGFAPRFSLEEGLAATARWYLQPSRNR